MRVAVLIAALALIGCSAGPADQVVISGKTMGTSFSVKVVGEPDPAAQSGANDEIIATLERINGIMSTYVATTEISHFNASESLDWQPVSEEFCNAVQHALELSSLTRGAFDVTVGPLVNLWGFGPQEMTFEPPSRQAIADVMARVGYQKLHADCSLPALRKDVAGLEVDLSAYGKGYAVDRIGEVLDRRGFRDYLVEVGGEILAAGANARGEQWAIGIEIPRAGVREPYTVVRLTGFAVATSGDYRNFFEHEGVRYSHEIDPDTGMPVTHDLAAVSIIDESAAAADALATGLMVMGPDAGFELAARENIAALFLTRTENGIAERASPRFEELTRQL